MISLICNIEIKAFAEKHDEGTRKLQLERQKMFSH